MVAQELIRWYEDKTQFLVEKYGPGPRVHYHTGLAGKSPEPRSDADGLRIQLRQSQERMLDVASSVWDAYRNMRGDIVDVGCGLGGSCLYFADKFGSHVTGVTLIPRHIGVCERFAQEAGVSDRVSFELGDAHEIPGNQRFDAAYAFGAVNYFDRRIWFARMAELIRPGGHVFIEDTVFVQPEMAAPFNAYWLSNMGTKAEYVEAAKSAGFVPVRFVDVTDEAAGFWRLSGHYSELLVRDRKMSEGQSSGRMRSIEWQAQFYAAYLEHRVENVLLHFRLPG